MSATRIKLIAMCVILDIALIDSALNLIAFLPGLGDIVAGAGEIVLEIIQGIAAMVAMTVGRKKIGKLRLIYGFCAFCFLGLLDVGISIIGALPIAGDIAKLLGEVVLEILQVAIVAILTFL